MNWAFENPLITITLILFLFFALTWVDFADVNPHSCWWVSGYRRLLCEDVSHSLWWQRAISILWTPGRSLPLFTHMHCSVLNNMHKPSFALIYYLKIFSIVFFLYLLDKVKLVFALPQTSLSNIVYHVTYILETMELYCFFPLCNVGKNDTFN